MTTPYGAAAADYLAAGWSPLPLPSKEKHPPPTEYTGASGAYITAKDVKGWTRKVKPVRIQVRNLSYLAGNIALRLPKTVIGIDVDRYGGKSGARTMEEATENWGQLPATWISSSRDDGSGIALYRIPEGLGWPGQVGPGVEILRWDHRYAIVAPSLHPEGRTYSWIHPDGRKVDDEFPAPDDLPPLPASWVEGLTNGKRWQEREVGDLSTQEVRDWLAARNSETCEAMRKTLASSQRLLRAAGDDGGAHDVARDGAWAIIGDSAAGHGGVQDALVALKATFKEGISTRPRAKEADAEWARIVVRGVQKVSAEGEPESEDICAAFASGVSFKEAGPGSGAFDYTRDDIGNGERLKRHLGTDAHYVPELKGWALYRADTSLWEIDTTNHAIMREAMAVQKKMETEAKFIEEPKARAAFLGWVRTSGNVPKLKAMIEVCGAAKGVHARGSKFDARPELLVCSNGTVELNKDGSKFRGTRHADYSTLTTGSAYDPKARSTDWDKFLERVVPNEDDLRWIQTLMGYSLLGKNPERALVIAKGPTSGGKTTFTNAIMGALGEHSSMFNLTMLRDKQDESARTDVVQALPKRLLVASETGSEWQLHADTIKRMTGGEPLRARMLNSNHMVERVPAFTMWITTNAYPTIPGADLALWRRLKAAPFLVSLPEDEVDVGLTGRLSSPEARSAILAWCVRGWDIYCTDGLREPSAAASVLELEARDEMSDLDMWLAECCDRAAEYTETVAALFDNYRMWHEINGNGRAMGKVEFSKKLGARGHKDGMRRTGSGDTKERFRQGLRLNAANSRRVV